MGPNVGLIGGGDEDFDSANLDRVLPDLAFLFSKTDEGRSKPPRTFYFLFLITSSAFHLCRLNLFFSRFFRENPGFGRNKPFLSVIG